MITVFVKTTSRKVGHAIALALALIEGEGKRCELVTYSALTRRSGCCLLVKVRVLT